MVARQARRDRLKRLHRAQVLRRCCISHSCTFKMLLRAPAADCCSSCLFHVSSVARLLRKPDVLAYWQTSYSGINTPSFSCGGSHFTGHHGGNLKEWPPWFTCQLFTIQAVQRQLEEVAEKQRDLEERGVAVEKSIRREAGAGKPQSRIFIKQNEIQARAILFCEFFFF